MSWSSKVVWAEGLFLKPHHLQQNDRYLERLLETRVRQISAYPWGFASLEIDRDLAGQSRFALRRGSGVMPDGTPFSFPDDSPAPPAIVVPETAVGQTVWLSLPLASPNAREVDPRTAESAARFTVGTETIIDSTSDLRQEEEIDVAHPRLAFELRKGRKPGYVDLPVARIQAIQDKAVVFDERMVPPILVSTAHPVVTGWLDRVVGWVEHLLETLARYAADPGAGGSFQQSDYFVLQILNRTLPALRHMRGSAYLHPERLFSELLRLVGDLATFAAPGRRVKSYGPYDHDDLGAVFEPLLRDIDEYLRAPLNRGVRRLELRQIADNAYEHLIVDRRLFQTSTFVLEVAAERSLVDIQAQIPHLLKIGPSNRMKELIQAALPGIPILWRPVPPQQLKILNDHVYFFLDKASPLWPEFSSAPKVALHFAGDWPKLDLILWAISDER